MTGTVMKCSVEELGLEDEAEKSSNSLLGRGWSPGWSNADKALTEFAEQHLIDYVESRLKVGTSTSLLSPYLHFGELSVRKVFQCVQLKQLLWAKEENLMGKESVTLFLRSIGLREYSRYLCFNFPFTHERSLLSNLKYFPWNDNQVHFKAWRQGRTGYPLVDAGMRELWATGWIHNKIRVIVSSFAVKVLLLPWRWGMKYFWDTLLDADLESDILGWQYISGSLPDAHELERLDNPEVYWITMFIVTSAIELYVFLPLPQMKHAKFCINFSSFVLHVCSTTNLESLACDLCCIKSCAEHVFSSVPFLQDGSIVA
jgi:cryptochrome 2